MKKLLLALLCCASLAHAQTAQDLLNDGKNADNVTTYGMGYDHKRYSPLKQINTANVKRLVPVWNASLSNLLGEQAQPLVYEGVMYVTNAAWTFAFDVASGTQLWRRYTIPGPGEKGYETWPQDEVAYKRGGATTWVTGSYDPQLDLTYWGTGNTGPWNAKYRQGDSLYAASVIAVRPKTGEIVWHYQYTPDDTYDYNAVNEHIIADIRIDGEMRKVLLHADRNGFFM
jgi:glucose dehydrogenase